MMSTLPKTEWKLGSQLPYEGLYYSTQPGYTEEDMLSYAAAAVAAESERLRAENEAHQKSAAWCEKHKPSGDARGTCLVCACIAYSSSLSQISYVASDNYPNEMECGPYDFHHDDGLVVEQVRKLRAEVEALRKDAERAVAAERERWQKWTCRKEWGNVNDPPCHPGDKDWSPCPACVGPKPTGGGDDE